MDSRAKKIFNRIIGTLIFAALGLGLSWFAGRMLTCAYQLAGDAAMSMGLALVMTDIPTYVFNEPFYIDFSQPMIIAVCALLLFGPILLAIANITRGMKLDNEDTGREHGDDRLATKREARAFLDKRYKRNNIFYSNISGLAIHSYDKKTQALTEGKNLNHLCIGISGQGKTFNMVMSELFSAVGDALPYRSYGLSCLLSRFIKTPPMRLLRSCLSYPFVFLSSFIKAAKENRQEKKKVEDALESQLDKEAIEKEKGEKEAQAQQNKLDTTGTETKDTKPTGAEAEQEESIETQSYKSEILSLWQETKEQIHKSADAQTVKTSSKQNKKARAKRKRRQNEARAQINAGYDVVNTDPKGENIRDTAWMFKKAGFDVKVVNTVDFTGWRVNPFEYIPERRTDSIAREYIKCDVSGSFKFAPRDTDGSARKDLKFQEELTPNIANKHGSYRFYAEAEPEVRVEYDLDLKSTLNRYEDIGSTALSSKQIEEALLQDNLKDEERSTLFLQKELKSIEESMGGYLKGTGKTTVAERAKCERVLETLKGITYKRSYGKLSIEVKYYSPERSSGSMTINLGRNLEVIGTPKVLGNSDRGKFEVIHPSDKENKSGELKIIWKMGGIAAKSSGDPEITRLEIPIAITAQVVADGVMLTKVVDTLVSNLHGTDAKSAGSDDPFWEDAKRLMFMSIIAYMFERYPRKYRNIPTMMRLINMATPGERGEKTQLEILMNQWQEGIRITEREKDEKSLRRGTVSKITWEATDNPPHDINTSIALHCYLAYARSADDTFRSLVITCKTALVPLLADDVQDFLSTDEVGLDTLGEPGQKQIIYLVTQDTDSPFDFITALFVQLAIDLAQQRAFRRGGKLYRHVRFILDEVANIGKIPILVRALAVVRSRNISISMFVQSRSQLYKVYSREETDIIFDNCTTITFLGAQTTETLDDISKRIGTETVYSRVYSRQFSDGSRGTSSSENIQATARNVRSASQLRRLSRGTIIVMIFGQYAILDQKFQTHRSGLFPYVMPSAKRGLLQPPCECEAFDYLSELRQMRTQKESEKGVIV